MVFGVEVDDLPTEPSGGQVATTIAAPSTRSVMPLVQVELDPYLRLHDSQVEPSYHLAVLVSEPVLSNEVAQLWVGEEPLGHPLSVAVGDDPGTIRPSEHPAQQRRARRTGALDPFEGSQDPPFGDATTDGIVESALDGVVADHGAEVAERPGDGGHQDPVDHGQVILLPRQGAVSDDPVLMALTALRDRYLDRDALPEAVEHVEAAAGPV